MVGVSIIGKVIVILATNTFVVSGTSGDGVGFISTKLVLVDGHVSCRYNRSVGVSIMVIEYVRVGANRTKVVTKRCIGGTSVIW